MYTRFDSPIGEITVVENGSALTHVLFRDSPFPAQEQEGHSNLLYRAREAILSYLDGRRTTFDLPLAAHGTAFQESVWQALLTIPYGQTRTYGQLAVQIGNPKACRAVGMANHHNPISLIIPCHRVIGADGSMTGYGGGLDIKVFLLELEARTAPTL